MKKKEKIFKALRKNIHINKQLDKKAKYLSFIFISKNFYKKSKIYPLIVKNRLYNNKLAKENRKNNLKRKIFNLFRNYYYEITSRRNKNNKY